jgi:hypothetical protein
MLMERCLPRPRWNGDFSGIFAGAEKFLPQIIFAGL